MTSMLAPDRPTLLLGAPGSGKTRTAVDSALDFLVSGEDSGRLLVLSPTRDSAAVLRNAIEGAWARSNPKGAFAEQPSRSFAAYAFWVLSEARRQGFITFRARLPRLLAGAEQDRIIREILLELIQEGTVEHWPESVRGAATTDGFRREVRELFDRAREHGLSPEDLQLASEQQGVAEWAPAAQIYSRYLERFSSQEFEDAYDPAGLVSEAVRLLSCNPDLLVGERQRLQRIIVDDAQEATPSVLALLRLIGAGKPVLALANPDAVTQGFRGAVPGRLKDWGHLTAPDPEAGLHGKPPTVQLLNRDHGMSSGVAGVYARTVQFIPAPGGDLRDLFKQHLTQQHSEQDRDSGTRTPGVEPPVEAEAVTATSEHAAERSVLAEILHRHDRHAVPLSQIAVIARSGTSAQRTARALTAHGIPVRQSMRDVVLHQEPAVAPLLSIIEWACDTTDRELELPDVLWLLGSRYGGTDAFGLRILRQQLRRTERDQATAEGREPCSSDELILIAAADPADPVLAGWAKPAKDDRPETTAYGLKRIALMLQAAQQAVSTGSTLPSELLWEVWEAAGLAETWREATRGTGWEAEQADHDLDAVLALFHAADRFETQNPGADAAAFAEHMQRLELPMDTLAESAVRQEAVEVLTPTTAAGRHFDTVILVDLQRGVWPNLRPRGALLRSRELADWAEGTAYSGSDSPMVQRIQTLQDEYRLFAAAVSRAKNRLFAVAVESEQERPSPLLELITPAAERPEASSREVRLLTDAALVAELRRSLENELHDHQGRQPSQRAEQAAQALAHLAASGVRAAHPQSWWGLPQLSTEAPVFASDEPLRISPSAVEAAITQPLQWFTSRAGGTEPAEFSRMLGTLIHQIAEEHYTQVEPKVLHQVLEEKWHTLRMEGWEAQAQKNLAREMLTKLAKYQQKESHREVVAVEAQGAAELTLTHEGQDYQLRISGSMDRIERLEGQLRIIDLKTGNHLPSADDTQRNPQLGIYQLLTVQDPQLRRLGEVQEAALLNIRKNQTATLRSQDPVSAEDQRAWVYQQLRTAAEVMTVPAFESRHEASAPSSGKYNRCRVGPLCPLCDDTQQVTQP
ncbi:ATP-dependent DNA helicase [Nesterenkonia ebinurensis]|uniref:ATP-dependent DNA helicase n=1 Tax=Nesterenkonia ebinurensis TaxID=2608252 RepID=UPI00168BCC8A|nr:ATP-dependent DNA helicase [Nesterenkonia ebinurensis]